MSHPQVTIYTDGACSGNPGPGGWGALMISGEYKKEISGSDPETTNNRMELMAIIQALETLTKASSVDLYTDSRYAKDGTTQWMANWKKNGWRTADKKEVKNKDLWEVLDTLTQKHTITWHWVKGHSGDPMNERVDALARNAIISAMVSAQKV